MAYYPMVAGLLTVKYRRNEAAPEGIRLAERTERLEAANFDVIEAVESFARERGLRMIDVAIGGLAAQPAGGSVIAGARAAEQVRSTVAAGAWAPDAADLAELDRITN